MNSTMKKNGILISAFILAILISACNVSDNPTEEDIKLVEKYQEAFKSHDVDGMKALLADTYVGYGPSLGDSMKKDEAIINWDYNMQHLFEKLEFQPAQTIAVTNDNSKAKGQWVSSWGKLYVKFKEHGNEATIWSNKLYLIDDGQIQKSYIFFNEADALRQAGYSYIFNDPNKRPTE